MKYEFYGDMRPFKHQWTTIKFMLKYKRAYLFNDMGTGKTASCLWFCDMLMDLDKINKVLIIAPLSTLHVVWGKEIQSICPYRNYAIVHGSRSDRLKALESDSKFFITNTDAPRTYEKELIKLNPDVIIIDEITSFANPRSRRSKAIQRIAAKCNAVYGLTGSPVAGGLMNSFGIAKVVNPEALPTPYVTRYRDLIMYQVTMYEYIPKPGALEIVNKTLSPAIKFRLEDCIDLPPMLEESRNVAVAKETHDLFKQVYKHQIAEYKDGIITASTAGVKAIRLIQILTGFSKNEEGVIERTNVKSKLSELFDIYHEAGNKLVVFCQFIETLKIIQEFFIEKKISCDIIYGDVSLKNRKKIIDKFQGDGDGVLAAQLRTMSHGIDLTSSHVIALFGPVSGNEAYRQALRRIRRISQKHPQTVVKITSTKFEERIFKRLDEEELTGQALLDLYENPDL